MKEKIRLDHFLQENYTPAETQFEVRTHVPGLILGSKHPSNFVVPILSGDAQSVVDESPVLLISAPGAMGKSMVSQTIAATLNAPRLDLAMVTVGEATHVGLLVKSMTRQSYADYSVALSQGKASLVIDALDEAPVRSGDRAFEAFMKSLAEDVSDYEIFDRQVIVMGRPQTIDIFHSVCRDVGFEPSILKLDSLPLESSLDLINLVISEDQRNTSQLIHKDRARDYWKESLFNLGSTLTAKNDFSEIDWELASDFIGYPPVVASLAPSLAAENYQTALNLINLTEDTGDRASILLKIIEAVLNRERAKVQRHLANAFDSRIDPAHVKALYNPEEQICRLLDKLGIAVDQIMPAHLNADLRGEYEQQMRSFILDHPLLGADGKNRPRNIVFSDFLRASVDSKSSYIPLNQPLPIRAESLLPVGPFYVYFLSALKRAESDNGYVSEIDNEDFVKNIIDSWTSGAQDLNRLYVVYTHRDNDDPQLELFESFANRDPRKASFELRSPSGVLALSSPVRDLTVHTDHGVFIEATEGSIVLGPHAQIIASSLETDKIEQLKLRQFDESSNSSRFQYAALIAVKNIEIPGTYSVVEQGSKIVSTIYSPQELHQLRAYRPKFSPVDGIDRDELINALILLRRILASFTSLRDGTLGVNCDKFARLIVGRNSMMMRIVVALREIGLIKQNGAHETISNDNLQEYGINYSIYQDPAWEAKLLPLLITCFSKNAALFDSLKRQSGLSQ